MKTLRYLLITFAVMMVIGVSAQSLAQPPSADFQSTSSMLGSGSNLPQAAQSGVVMSYDLGASERDNKPGIRKGWGTGDNDRPEPYEDPIGDGVWAMVLLACAYVIFRYVRTRKSSHVAAQR